MTKKPAAKSDRSDPRKNKSLAIRTILRKMPKAKAADVAAGVKKEFGHDVSQNMVYMVKTKLNMSVDGRPTKRKMKGNTGPMTSPARWIEAIASARDLLDAAGGMANAVALLKAVAT